MNSPVKDKVNSVFESPFIQVLKKSIRKIEVPLPLARITANVIPLAVGDDASLRTAVMSPANYDREMLQLLYNKSELINPSSPTDVLELSFEQFCDMLTTPDKLMLIWGVYKATYGSLGKRIIECPNESCNGKFEADIDLDSLINEDSIHPWDKDVPVNQYVYPISIEDNDSGLIYTFDSHIPSIRRINAVLSRISSSEIRHNLETLGSPYTLKDIVVSITKKISIHHKNDPDNVIETSDFVDIDQAFSRYIKKSIWEEYRRQYDEHFDKYNVRFYTKLKCPRCHNEFEYDVDLELEFFRRSLLE